jgi:Leucine-rich repeat (LRR) protein
MLPNVYDIWMQYNFFSGTIPVAIKQASALERLFLGFQSNGDGSFGGVIPKELGELPNLVDLDIHGNNFIGIIPPELASISSLETLDLSSNKLTGLIPPELGKLINLVYLNLAQNRLTGPLPAELGQLKNLTKILVYNNKLNGTIPSSLTTLENLFTFDVHNNYISGSIPAEFFDSGRLMYLDMSSNAFSGQIPHEIGNDTQLMHVDLSQNQLTGPLPAQLAYLVNLRELRLHNNKLNGTFPLSLVTWSELWSFDVHGNSISGSIPELLNCLNLTYFDMSDNELSGEMNVPISFISLQFLNLSYNHFVGPIPLFLFGHSPLIKVDLSYNFLGNSNIFASSSNEYNKACAPLLQELYLQGNSLSEQDLRIYTLLGCLSVLNTLNLAQNDLKGLIPQEIGLFNASLVVLNLSWNQFSGTIPTTLGSLQALQVLDLSHNQLSGTILPSLGTQLISLKSINVSYNHLNGSLPSSWVRFLVANYDSFIGNPGLCLKYSSRNQCIKNVDVHIRIMIIVISCVVFIVGLSIFTCCYIRRRSKSTLVVPNDMEILSVLGSEISFNNIMEATQNLSDDYIIGKGGQGIVYKAVLHNGNVVAVKKIPLLNKDIKIHKSFLREINTIGKVKHRNLVKLLGFCKLGKIALVVYNYFPNGDLFDAIHNKERGIVLDWDTRLKIVEGIAHGLAYLHHYCVPPIIHRDIKSRNVLLDVDMEAHITDFGIAKAIALKPNEDYVNTTITFEGTYGYIAPGKYELRFAYLCISIIQNMCS